MYMAVGPLSKRGWRRSPSPGRLVRPWSSSGRCRVDAHLQSQRMVSHAQKDLKSYNICATSCCFDRILSGSLKRGAASRGMQLGCGSSQFAPVASEGPVSQEALPQWATGLCVCCQFCEATRHPPPPGRTECRGCLSPCQAVSPSVS